MVLPDLPEIPEEPAPVVKPDTQARQPDPAPAPAAGSDDPEPAARGQEPVVYTRPVKGEVLRPFSVEALTLDPTLGDWRTHGGVDLAAAIGTEVLAMGPGTVFPAWKMRVTIPPSWSTTTKGGIPQSCSIVSRIPCVRRAVAMRSPRLRVNRITLPT